MSDINIHELIREKFATLPEKLQEALTSTEIAEKLRAIALKHRLHIDQGQILENETYMVLLGIERAENYEKNIEHELSLSQEDARVIAAEVAQEVFLSVREALKERTSDRVSTPEATTKAPETPIEAPKPMETTVPTENKFTHVMRQPHTEIEISSKGNTRPIDPYREPLN